MTVTLPPAVAAVVAAGVKTAPAPTRPWSLGPICLAHEYKAHYVDTERYADWVAAVESMVKSPKETAQRLRLVHYSATARPKNALFDKILATEDSWTAAPLTVAHGPQPAIDGLIGTGAVVGFVDPSRPPVDVSHVWVLADACLNGLGFQGKGFDVVADPIGAVSWVGDLASWWESYNSQRVKAMVAAAATSTAWSEPIGPGLATPLGWLDAATAARCGADDLLGDMDAIVLMREFGALPATATTPMADLLRAYYGPSPVTVGHRELHADHRFHHFVHRAQPAIPHTYDENTGHAALTSDTQRAIRAAVEWTAGWILRVTRYRAGAAKLPRNVWPGADLLQDKGLFWAAVQASVGADLTSPWGAAMLDEIAKRFTEFLANGLAKTGWDLNGWPVANPMADYGGFMLRIGDNDNTRRYGGVANAVATATDHVRRLQQSLADLGFGIVGTPDGIFGGNTALAIRELQIEAQAEYVCRKPKAGTTVSVELAARRFRGVVNGVVDWETALTLKEWLAPVKDHVNVCPVRVDARAPRTDGAPGAVHTTGIWHRDAVTADVRMWAVDHLERYPIPATRVVAGGEPGMVAIGRYTSSLHGGPVIDKNAMWDEATVSTANLLPPGHVKTNAADASRFRVLAAIAKAECISHYDSINAYDAGIVSIGIYHWALHRSGIGELAAFLAYYRQFAPREYERNFGRFGVYPEKVWDPATWRADGALAQAKYVGRVALYGLKDASGAVHTHTLRPLEETNGNAYAIEHLRTWHWIHRLAMAMRTSPTMWHMQWEFGLQRVRDLLGRDFTKADEPNRPVVPRDGGGFRVATFGEVFTSEKAVTALVRFHVNRPGDIIDGSGAKAAIRSAYTNVFGTGAVDLTKVPATERDDRQRSLVTEVVAAAPQTDTVKLQDSINTALGFSDPELGGLKDTAGSFLGP